MKRKIKIAIIIVVFVIVCIIYNLRIKDNSELKSIKSEKQLSRIYDGDDSLVGDIFYRMLTIPFSILRSPHHYYNYATSSFDKGIINTVESAQFDTAIGDTLNSSESSSKDYSTTNIQVENVDEADITKTDGDYIYSISENNVIITNVIDPNDIKIESKISSSGDSIPEDLILYKDELVVISADVRNTSSYYRNNNNTIVEIYDISDKSKPRLLKNYELYEGYYTSRCIGNKLYVIASGNLRKDNDKIITYYNENNLQKDIELNNIKYLKNVKTNKQTLISVVDLDRPVANVDISSYLIDISNAYVSENSIYLLNEKYDYNDEMPLKTLFGLKGAIGPFVYTYEISTNYHTEIYKFDISKDSQVNFDAKTKIKGRTINQYSLDEYKNHLRIALYDNDGARVSIFDKNLKEIGTSDYVAKGETMYSSRFIDNKVYLVTYKTVDPLFVIDLSNESHPEVLGKLKIPGYSTYLHPYDEDHLIGIGMETEEIVNRNSNGTVISTTARIIGMKMALFDVSNVNNPIEIANTVIGDRRTTSAILTNPKALLFSKAKNLIAIPVNNYSEDFEINSSSDSYSSIINSYKNYGKSYVAEGYFVYNINLEDGFNLKGVITHEKDTHEGYYYYNNSKLLRGLYIDNNLYTVSENAIKVNDLNTLDLISEMKIN